MATRVQVRVQVVRINSSAPLPQASGAALTKRMQDKRTLSSALR